MTDEQKAAYVHAQSVAATAQIEGMKATNTERERDGKALAYDELAFQDIINEYGLHSNALITLFHGH